MTPGPSSFEPDFVETACTRINEHHADDALAIARGLGGCPAAEQAVVTGFDDVGLELAVTTDGQLTSVRVPFLVPVISQEGVRAAFVHLARTVRGPRNET